MDAGIKKTLAILFLSLFFTQTAQGSAICDFSQEGEPLWESAAFILANTFLDAIPEVKPWEKAFLQLLELTQTPSYSTDLTECVKTLIEQELDDRVLQSTQTFFGYWNTTIAVWNDSLLVSNASHTKAEMADLIWSEAFGGALEHLPEIAKKEQVMVQWLDIASSEVFIFESTAVQYTAQFGNGSSESCHQWKTAQLYISSLVDNIDKNMTNCPGSCLNTSTFKRSATVCNDCDFPWTCYYWVGDVYNSSCAKDRGIHGECGAQGVGSDCHCPNVPPDSQCQWQADNYSARLREYIRPMRLYLEHIMDWMHNRQEVIKEQLDTWCPKNKMSLITP